ncbi:hypothetical protein Tamer19_15040 [Cupriavidus sp. TA19]|uniref:BatD family protein n=1 Tax=unclassified Cupriavidus TaxID=2640874 RepID=UPI0027294DEF|nr:BatD family protein [Cupriavidus sp. TA19]GLC92096.1 hypothetical protein Tamer19_15040 [Cupriavidus sp. TA19]
MTARLARWLLLCALLLPWLAHAAAEPRVRVEVGARQPVLVGQQVAIDVTILAPNFFMSAPAFPVLQVPGAVITMPDERAQNSTETIDGITYAGIRKRYAFTAEQDGDFELPAATVRFTYAGEDGAPRQGSVTFPATRIRAGAGGAIGTAGQGAGAARPLLPVARLTVTQALDPAARDGAVYLHAGDALVRTVTTFAPQTQAMMIRPPHVPALRGVRLFSADPRLSDHAGGAGDATGPGGTRVDTFTYVFERSGTYTLPPVTVDWFDAATRQPAHSEVPAIRVVVAAARGGGALAPGGPSAGALPGEGGMPWRMLGWAGVVLLGMLAAAVSWRRLRPVMDRWRQRLAARRQARAEGARARLEALLGACQAGDPVEAYRALGAWVRTTHGTAPAAWAEASGDSALAGAVAGLERRLYGPADAASRRWDGSALAEALRRNATTAAPHPQRLAAHALPPLNP